MNTNSCYKFYEKETPQFLAIVGGELRLYRKSGRLMVSKNSWVDENGVSRIGKTVSINLGANKGNVELISFLQSCIDELRVESKT